MSPFIWLPLLIGGSGLGVLVAKRSIDQQNVQQTWQSLRIPPLPEQFGEQQIQDLPEPVQRYFRHAIAPGTPLARAIELKMYGQFRLKADAPWMAMEARQILAPWQGLVWQASVKNGLIRFSGADICDVLQQSGRIQFFLWGLVPVAQASSGDTLRSALGRLALESVWLPTALLPQFGVQWQAIDDSTIQASWMLLDEPITITLQIDAQGRVQQAHMLRWSDQKRNDLNTSETIRPQLSTPNAQPTPSRTANSKFDYVPFCMRASEESTIEGLTIPTQLAVSYYPHTPQEFEFFRATVASADPLPPQPTSAASAARLRQTSSV
ncbi:MAG: DUF6544 family protein [Thainema sp.]